MLIESLIDFPCDFPIKVMGLNSEGIRQLVLKIASDHKGDNAQDLITERPSRSGKYVSFTLTLNFANQDEIDDVYVKLTAIDGVSMVL